MASSARAQSPHVDDSARFFSQDALDKANAKAAALAERFHTGIYIETLEDVPPEVADNFRNAATKAQASDVLANFHDDRAASQHFVGVYVLLLKAPVRYVSVSVSKEVEDIFSRGQRDTLRDLMVRSLADHPDDADRYDRALAAGLDYIERSMVFNTSDLTARPHSPAAVEQIATLLKQLDDADPATRSDANDKLLMLDPSSLGDLVYVVNRDKTYDARQRTVIRDVALQLWRRANAAPPKPTPDAHGVLGISASEARDAQHPMRLGEATSDGLVVTKRFRGFESYSVLRDSDIIVSIEMYGQFKPTPSIADLIVYVEQHPLTQPVTLRIRRGGVVREVTLNLTPRPTLYGGVDFSREQDLLDHEAQRYFDRHFEVLGAPSADATAATED